MPKIMQGTTEEEILELIQPLTHVLGVNIEIVDKNLVRIVGTGIYKYRIGDKVNEPVYEKVLREEKLVVVENPTKNVICKKCIVSNDCTHKIIMAVPLYFKKEITGVLSFFCSDENRKNRIMENIESYGLVLENFAESISARYFKNDYKEIYQELFNRIGKAVIITDKDGIIVEYNRLAHKVFTSLKELEGKKMYLSKDAERIYTVLISGVKKKISADIKVTKDDKSVITFSEIPDEESEKHVDGILIGKSKVVENLNKTLQKLSETNAPILITGEVGTDKDMFAKWIHNLSSRSGQKFMSINCADEDVEKLEEKIFGNDESGSFRLGYLEAADKGTVFFDDIDVLPLELQKKLLYFLKNSSILREGSEKGMSLDVRVMVGTRKDLRKLTNENLFLENLYYKISSMILEIPGLTYRKDDMEEIIDFLIKRYEKYFGKKVDGINSKAKKILCEHEWVGNWKELENTMRLIVDLTENEKPITEQVIPESIKVTKINYVNKYKKIRRLSEVEREEIVAALVQYGFETEGKKKAALKLGIGIATLYRKIETYKIEKDEIVLSK